MTRLFEGHPQLHRVRQTYLAKSSEQRALLGQEIRSTAEHALNFNFLPSVINCLDTMNESSHVNE